jgi:hypothetical protein
LAEHVSIWRRRVSGAVVVGAAYGLPVALPQLHELKWHWFGSVWFIYGEPLSLLPGVLLVALLAPLVSYRRRDALTMFFPLRGIRVAWIIGTRLSQLPQRDWPARADGLVPLHDRRMARIAMTVNRYRNWRSRRAQWAVPPADATGLTPRPQQPTCSRPRNSRTPEQVSDTCGTDPGWPSAGAEVSALHGSRQDFGPGP